MNATRNLPECDFVPAETVADAIRRQSGGAGAPAPVTVSPAFDRIVRSVRETRRVIGHARTAPFDPPRASE